MRIPPIFGGHILKEIDMLILNTPKGDFAIAKGNIHTIHQDYYQGYIYVTKDMACYPFRRINGIKVKDIDHALELVDEYADDNGEQPLEIEADEETKEILRPLHERWREKLERTEQKLKPLSEEVREQ